MGTIKMSDLRQRVREMGLKIPFTITKIELIRAIQRAEGNFPCFGTAGNRDCDQAACCWRMDCLGKEN